MRPHAAWDGSSGNRVRIECRRGVSPSRQLETVSGGDPDDPVDTIHPFYTLHADFWNTWDQDTLNQLVNTCLNGNVDCGKL